MERYRPINHLGSGTYGNVWKAFDTKCKEMVAVKVLKQRYYSWEQCLQQQEVDCLKSLRHPNIVRLKGVVQKCNRLFFIFEFMEMNLYRAMKDLRKYGASLDEPEIRDCCWHLLHGLAYMHKMGYFHRDLKPENILLNDVIIKIADFGFARKVDSPEPYTDYVTTRWYRAPEVLLEASSYTTAVDMWAMGAIMAELFTFQPLFPGANQVDQIHKICSIISTPDNETWAQGMSLAHSMKFSFPQCTPQQLSDLIPNASPQAIDLISALCSWDPTKRPTAEEALCHPFLQTRCPESAIGGLEPEQHAAASSVKQKRKQFVGVISA